LTKLTKDRDRVRRWLGSQKPDDEIRCPNPLAYSRKKLMAVHALPAASALANSSRGIDGRREPSLEARSTGTDCCRNALCVLTADSWAVFDPPRMIHLGHRWRNPD